MLIQPVYNRRILLIVKLHLDCSPEAQHLGCCLHNLKEALHHQMGETHALEVPPVSLLTTHHDPHCAGEKKRHFLKGCMIILNKTEIAV